MSHCPKHTTFIAITPTMRRLIENVIEDLMLLLDEIDDDADLEDDDLLDTDSSPQTQVNSGE